MAKNKPSIPRFMVAENPMAEKDVEYIIHTQEPRFIARKVDDNPITNFEIVDEIDNIGEFFKYNELKISGLMRRLGDWWVSYTKWEEQQNNEEK